jgi:hypothetical protein
MDLRPGLGIRIATTAGRNHWSVWGRPDQLLDCVADVENVATRRTL